MAKLELTNEQLWLVKTALDFYSRIGIGQMDEILSHPTYEKILRDKLRPVKKLEVGDRTERGIIVEINEGSIKTKGSWGNGNEIREWMDVENIKLSLDYGILRDIEDEAKKKLNEARNLLLQDNLSESAYLSIHNKEVDESCRVAFDLIQVIRHEFWKKNPNKTQFTVDSSVMLWTSDGSEIKCDID